MFYYFASQMKVSLKSMMSCLKLFEFHFKKCEFHLKNTLNSFFHHSQLEVIGGTDKYMASCRLCHDKVLDGRTTKKELKMERKPLESIENTRRQKLANGMSGPLFSL